MSVILNDERFSLNPFINCAKKNIQEIINISLKSRTCLSRQLTKKIIKNPLDNYYKVVVELI